MTTSRPMPNLSEPTGRTKIPKGALAYVGARTRTRIFNMIWREFTASGISKADLAARLGKGPDQISHWLAAPGNLTLESVGQILFAISGAELSDTPEYPLRRPDEASTPSTTRDEADLLNDAETILAASHGD